MGCQEPTFRVAQQYEHTQGIYAAKVMTPLGVVLDPWQKPILDDWLAVKEDGTYVHMRCVLVVPRQNGKTLVIEARIITGILKGEVILYTAHDYSTVTKLFDRLKHYFGEKANDPDAVFPELNRMVKSVRKAIGKEAIFLKNGAVIYLSTRTKSAKRGYTVDVFIGDEAQELTEVQAKAMLSTASSGEKQNPQFIYCGTPPDAECNGDILPSLRNEAYKDPGEDLVYTEWSASEVGEIFDIDRWYRYNPSLGLHMTERVLYGIAKTFTDPTSFAQECLGYFLPTQKRIEHLIEEEAWNALIVDPPESGELFFSIKFSYDGNIGAIAACLKPASDVAPLYVELVAVESLSNGITWFEDFALAVIKGCRRLIIDGGAIAEDLYDRICSQRVPKSKLWLTRAKDAVAAYEAMTTAVAEAKVSHMGQTPLADSATKTAKRKIGKDGFGFGSTDEADATLIEAASLALWIALSTKRNKNTEGADLWVL